MLKKRIILISCYVISIYIGVNVLFFDAIVGFFGRKNIGFNGIKDELILSITQDQNADIFWLNYFILSFLTITILLFITAKATNSINNTSTFNNISNDVIKNFSIASLSMLPIIGGPLSLILDKYLPDFKNDNYKKFFETIDNDFARIEEKYKINFNNREFLSIFNKILFLVQYESSMEKMNSFRAILINTAITKDIYFNEIEFFIKLIDLLTTDQIKILHILTSEKIDKKSFESMYEFISIRIGETDRDYILANINEMMRYHIITSSTQSVSESKMNINNSNFHRLTPLGENFVKFITLSNDNNF